WLNNWPMPGRTDYPLLFDRNYQAKPVVQEIIQLAVGSRQLAVGSRQ
ncbi:MAG: endo-1,4-beta-xylanase, partial [Prevotellaceae bacterium]|nr:endo-1,4-beta-xylanase [Prevotellaceae bacterium]